MRKKRYYSKRKKSKKIIVLIAAGVLLVALLSAMLIFRDYIKLSTVTSAIVNPISGLWKSVTEEVGDSFAAFGDNKELIEENRELKKQVSKLESEKVNILVLEGQIEKYEKLLKIQNEIEKYDIIASKKLFESTSNYHTGITINKGINSKIQRFSPVIYEEYLIGIVDSVDAISSRVKTIYEKNFSAIVKDVENGEIFRLRGNSTSAFSEYLICDYLPERSKIQVGDILETTTLADTYPASLKIGTIEKIDYEENGYPIKAYVKPFIDPRKLEYVYVLIDKSNEGEDN